MHLPFIMRGNHFHVQGHKQDLPHITCIFHLFKYVVNFLVSAILHHISLLRLLPKSYFNVYDRVLFNPIFFALAPLTNHKSYSKENFGPKAVGIQFRQVTVCLVFLTKNNKENIRDKGNRSFSVACVGVWFNQRPV